MILPAFYFMVYGLLSRYKLISVSIIILPLYTVTVTGIPVINPDSSSQRPLRLMAEGGLACRFTHFILRLAQRDS
ncbi:hypothetical protein RC98_21870 [Pectobacterium carotovorum subsp. carotovorum]|nr:hypothetical protein RC98_21870 [Pectobacterium carotovorum subsp. carotovorum]